MHWNQHDEFLVDLELSGADKPRLKWNRPVDK